MTLSDAWERSALLIHRWLEQRFPETPSIEQWLGSDYSRDIGGHILESSYLSSEQALAIRYQHPDSEVAQRTWTTEISLRVANELLMLGIRVDSSYPSGTRERPVLARPRIVSDVARDLGLRIGRRLDGRPWRLNLDDIEEFREFLLSPDRILPVYVLTQPDPEQLDIEVSEFLLDGRRLARETLGVAHVVEMPREVSFAWTDLVGKEWSAFLGAVRTYRPGLDFARDTLYSHPLALPDKILFWKDDDGNIGEKVFEKFLMRKAFEQGAISAIDWTQCKFVFELQSEKARVMREAGDDSESWKTLYEQEIEALNRQIEDMRKGNSEASQLAQLYSDENERLKQLNYNLQARCLQLQGALQDKGTDPDDALPIPTEYDQIPEWVETSLAGRLEMLPRATRSLKDAQYEDVGLVCQSLLLLANDYHKMRLRMSDSTEFESKCLALGLENAPSITKTRAGEEGDTYYVEYPPNSGRKQLLSQHLRKGNDRDARHCLRVYYFWDQESNQVIVGSLPGHLNTRSS